MLKIIDPLFSFELEGDWVEVPGEDPDLRTVRLADEGVQVAAAGLCLKLAPQVIETFARRFVEIRVKNEIGVAAKAGIDKVFIAKPQVVRRPWGYAIAYFGSDDRERHFSFSGVVTKSGVISIYAETFTGSRSEVSSVMDAIAGSLQFDRTPAMPPR